MAEHSTRIGGSSAERAIQCPASIVLAEDIPRTPPSSYAEIGTLCHKAMEIIVAAYFKSEAGEDVCEQVIGLVHTGENGDVYELDRELYDTKIIPAFNIFQSLIDDGTLGESLRIEQRLDFEDKVLDQEFGTADIIDGAAFDDGVKVCTILDWKFGDGVIVEVKNNSQALFYAAGASETHKFGKEADEFECIVVQPTTRQDKSISRWTATRAEVDNFKALIKSSVQAVEKIRAGKIEPKYRTGKHCKWCPAKPKCPQMQVLATQASKLNVTETSAETIAQWLVVAETLEEWIKSLNAYAFSLLENGQDIPGFKLVQKEGRSKISDAEGLEMLLRKKGCKVAEIKETKLLGVTALRKLLKKKKIDDKIINEFTSKNSSGLTMAPASDKRPAATSNAAMKRLSENLNLQ